MVLLPAPEGPTNRMPVSPTMIAVACSVAPGASCVAVTTVPPEDR